MKIAYICAALSLALSTAAFAEEAQSSQPPKTFVLTQEQAADYARRLSAENEQMTRQFQVNTATLQALQTQASKAEGKQPKS